MAKKSVKQRKSRKLIRGVLDKVSSKLFSDYSKELTQLIGREHGVYALYKGAKLYYVGLATNLRNRIKVHLKDKHAGKWDKFSLYLVRKVDHIREIESLLLQIVGPAGNATKGRLRHAENLKKELGTRIKISQGEHLSKLLGFKQKITKRNKAKKRKTEINSLSEYVINNTPIRRVYKGKTYKAIIRKNGSIYFQGKVYSSPSLAGRAVLKTRTPNGWHFWKYKDSKGNWVTLNNLRK